MRPLIVVVGSETAVVDALAEVRAAGWTVVQGWSPPTGADRIVCTGSVASVKDASDALLAAVAGAGLVIAARAAPDVLDGFCDDLQRLGRLDYRTGATEPPPRLAFEERALAHLLLEGLTLGQAARRLNLSRRTADRRMASVRKKLGVHTTAEALVALARLQPL